MKAGKTLQEWAAEIDRQNKAKKDYLVDTPLLSMCASEQNPVLHMARSETEIDQFRVNENAHRQISAKLEIPYKYYDRMLCEKPELLSHNVNVWFSHKQQKMMLRTLDGTARALLSQRYRIIDNYEVAETIMPILQEMPDVEVLSCDVTERRMYIKVLNPKLEAEIDVGDVVQSGFVISNSEVGHGAFNVSPLVYRLVCKNGMIAADSGLRKYHAGRINESDDNFELYRDETRKADDKAFLMKVQDIVKAAADESKFQLITDRMREATKDKLDPTSVPQVVELTAKEYSLTQDEGKGILGHLIESGELTLFGLANAATRYSQDVDDYDRATELEAAGWKILNMAPKLLQSMQTADAA